MRYLTWHIERLDELVALWNKELHVSLPMRKELFKQNSFLDKNISYEGSRMVVNDDDEVIGFIIVKYFKEKTQVNMRDDVGWIQAILVDSEYRHRGIGSELLKHAEAILTQRGLKQILLGRDMYHYLPGIPSEDQQTRTWFEKRDYKHFQSDVDMTRSYDSSEEIYWPSKPNVEFSIVQETEKEDLLHFLHRCFPGRWEHEAVHYFEKGGTGREFVVLKENGEIIGFCRINDSKSPITMGNINWAPLFNHELGGVGPLGVDSEKRKNGYGLAIVQAGIAFLRERGVNQIVIDWTGLIDFYRKLGYDVWKSYEAYQKEIG
ncbi:GNAT family N-acetyltransferase [Paucisalibacillus globulus]|uniref:GNAT family N-acetyltransferase n=1 Tax=Paucisalibacillus globulus TaxID=351095 RepID=UPI00041B58DD|nr:GNAT family N-acetyltransferase [Paucisalibacillus globulus]